MTSHERGLHELYRGEPESADSRLFGRRTDKGSRRGFLKGGGLSALSSILGARIPFAHLWPAGLIPAAFAQAEEPFVIPGKDGLTILNDKPLNAETPPHLLDAEATLTKHMFIRNNGLVPDFAIKQDASDWKLTIDGEVENPLTLSLAELRRDFKSYTYKLLIECAGNGRAGFFPPASGNQWTYGGVGCPEWTGVRLKDVLAKAKVKQSAVYTGFYGHDKHLSGDPNKVVISRGTPIAKALDDFSLIAFAMNGEPLHAQHGFPARLVMPGWPASTSGKWLKRLWIRDREHDGEKMKGHSYRMPRNPVAPGQSVPESDMVVIGAMPVKSLITFPKSGTTISSKDAASFACRGFAWAGDRRVKAVELSIDFGATWVKTKLSAPPNPHAWQRWSAMLKFPQTGYYEVWARATDEKGIAQPLVIPGWNPEGYLNNAAPRIAVIVA